MFRAAESPALQPLLGIGGSALIRQFADAKTLSAHRQALAVHHDEHRLHALMRLAHQPSGCLIEIQLAGRRAFDAHFMLDPHASDAVARADGAVRIRQKFRHEEQADALNPRRSVRQTRQHQMNDVLSQVMLTGGNEYLRAAHAVAAVLLRQRFGAQQTEIRAAMRLGQAHGAGPTAIDHLRQIKILQFLRAVTLECQIGSVRQARIQAKRQIAAADHLLHQFADAFGQALAAISRVGVERAPSAFDKRLICGLEPVGCTHHAVLVVATLGIAAGVERQERRADEFRGFLENSVEQIRGDFLQSR